MYLMCSEILVEGDVMASLYDANLSTGAEGLFYAFFLCSQLLILH